jgi:serine/threonine-protein kinase
MAQDESEASLGSRYVLLEEIGGGAMGTVRRARLRDTGEIVAVKLLRDGLAADQDLVLRFVQERNVMRSLRHPHIVPLRDFVIEGDRLALVMDLVEGGDLRGLLRQRDTLPPPETARLMAQVAEALAAAHALGVVHRDVKPANVLIDTAGRARLSDFGVARIVHGPGLTGTSSIIGTPAYLAPEVAEGDAATAAVDVYALGLILYELLAGRPPFAGDHPMALLRQHATAMPRRLPGMPDALWTLIRTCSAKDPAARPTAEAVAAALHQAAPALTGLTALPPVPRTDPASSTSEPLPTPPKPAPTPSQPTSSTPSQPAPSLTPDPLPAVPGPLGPATNPRHSGPGAATNPEPWPPGSGPATPGAFSTSASPPSGHHAPFTPEPHPQAAPSQPPSSAEQSTWPRGAGGPPPAGGAGSFARPSRKRGVLVASGALAVVLAGTALVVAAPWRQEAAPVAAPTTPPSTASTPPATPSGAAAVDIATPSPKSLAKPKERQETPKVVVTVTAAPPSPATTAPTQPVRTKSSKPKPRETEPETEAPPSEPPAPQWRCRSWLTTAGGVDMSPCMAVTGDIIHLKGQVRGSARSDVHVQLYDTDADTNLSQPFICADVLAPAGGVATCGPFTISVPRKGAKTDVRQRWRRTGSVSWSGGAESPYVVW